MWRARRKLRLFRRRRCFWVRERFPQESEAPHRSSQARGRGNEDAHLAGSGCATHENCTSVESHSMEALENLHAQFPENYMEISLDCMGSEKVGVRNVVRTTTQLHVEERRAELKSIAPNSLTQEQDIEICAKEMCSLAPLSEPSPTFAHHHANTTKFHAHTREQRNQRSQDERNALQLEPSRKNNEFTAILSGTDCTTH